MKQLKKPTVKQMQLIQSRRLDPNNWLVERELQDHIVIVNKNSKLKRNIYKI